MSFLKKIFDSILKFIRKICEALGPLFVVLMVALFVFAPYIGPWLATVGFPTVGGWVTAVGTTLSGIGVWGQLAIGLGVSYLLAPDATSSVVSGIADLVGDVASATGDIIGSGITGLVGSVFSSPIGLAVMGLGIWYVFFKKDENKVSSIDNSVENKRSYDE